jgi:hypothetical protein
MTEFAISLNQLELDVRLKLLDYYSAKSTSQGINGLTLSLVFFTFVTLIDNLKSFLGSGFWYILLLSFMFALFVTEFLRVGHRLVLWSDLSEAVRYVEMLDVKEFENRIHTIPDSAGKKFGKVLFGKNINMIGLKRGKKGFEPSHVDPACSSSFMYRLSSACDAWRETNYETRSRINLVGWIDKIGNNLKKVFPVIFFILFLLFALSVGIFSFHNGSILVNFKW